MSVNHTSQAKDVLTIATLVATAQNLAVNGRPCLIANTGAQPLYFHPTQVATAANGMLVPANSVFPAKLTVRGNLSVISNATGTSCSVLILDI